MLTALEMERYLFVSFDVGNKPFPRLEGVDTL